MTTVGGIARHGRFLVVIPDCVLQLRLVDDAPPHPTGAGLMLPSAASTANPNLSTGIGPRSLGHSLVPGCSWRWLPVRNILGRGLVGSTLPGGSGGHPSPELLNALPGSPGPFQDAIPSARFSRRPPSNASVTIGAAGPT